MQEKLKLCKKLVGSTVTEKNLRDVDCYVHNHLGLFIPSTGQCGYAIQPAHSHPSYMITIVFEPMDMMEMLDVTPSQPIRKDQYLASILSPDISHEESNEHFHRYYCVMIEKEFFESQYLLYEDNVPEFHWLQFPMCHDILKALNQFAFEYGKQMPNADITLDAQEMILTHWLIRSILGETYDMRAVSSDYGIARAEHYMEQHYGEKITVQGLAQLSNTSTSALNRGFRKETSMSPMEYLTEVRIGKAMKMLRRPERTITEIALACGFGSSAYFASVFRSKKGISPSEYRNQYKND